MRWQPHLPQRKAYGRQTAHRKTVIQDNIVTTRGEEWAIHSSRVHRVWPLALPQWWQPTQLQLSLLSADSIIRASAARVQLRKDLLRQYFYTFLESLQWFRWGTKGVGLEKEEEERGRMPIRIGVIHKINRTSQFFIRFFIVYYYINTYINMLVKIQTSINSYSKVPSKYPL